MNYDKSFIKEEIRCGYKISVKQKKTWWHMIEALKEFDRVCQKYNLRWYPIGGILIGVIRHQGFIPWDDDIDLAMPREDYNKFLKIAEDNLQYPYKLQTTFTDDDCFQVWASVRNVETTGNRECLLKTRQNNGIGIDILPIEGCEKNYTLFRLRRFPLWVMSVICNTYVNEINMTPKAVFLRKILKALPFTINYRSIHRWIERQNSKHPVDGSSKCVYTMSSDELLKKKDKLKRIIMETEDFRETIDMPFEYITLPVPIGYDRILRTEYYDYMQYPPLEERKGKHSVIFEPDIPYKEYCSENYGVKYKE